MKTFLTLFLLLSYTTYHSQNLILNGGFETATVAVPLGTPLTPYPTLLNGWSAVNTDGEFIYSANLAHTGTGFLSVLQNANGNQVVSWLGAPFVFQEYDRAIQVISVSASTTYHLQFWVRAGDGSRYGYSSGTLVAQVEQLLPTNLEIETFTMDPTLSWSLVSFDFTTGPSCTSVAILFSSSGTPNVDTWIDDVCLSSGETCEVTGLQTNDIPAFNVYPNPFTNQLTFSIADDQPSTLSLFDCVGRQVWQQTISNTTTINSEQLSAGVYMYQLNNNKGAVTIGKILKQ